MHAAELWLELLKAGMDTVISMLETNDLGLECQQTSCMKTALAQDQPSAEDEIKDGKKGASNVVLPDPEPKPKLPTPVVDAVTFLNRLVSDAVRH